MPTFQHIQAYPAKLIYIRMVDLGEKSDFRGSHGIIVWEEELEFEDTTCYTIRVMHSNGHHVTATFIW